MTEPWTTETPTETPTETSTDIPTHANEGCVGPRSQDAGKSSACDGCPNQTACATGSFQSLEALDKEEQETKALQQAFRHVDHVVLILSGKGGVGKSTMAAQLSHTLAARGYAVGLLDVDLCGPSAPRMAGVVNGQVHRSGSGAWTPVYATPNLAVMSISFLLQDTNAAVVWRGPRKNALIQQFLTETDWDGDTGGLDYLIIDTPPGTSDEHISTVQFLQKAQAVSGAVIVTTPEEVSMADVRKELNFCQKTKVPVLGVIENMGTCHSSLRDMVYLRQDGKDVTETVLTTLQEKCPEILDLLASSTIFATSGAGPKGMAEQYGVPFWGSIPLDPKLLACCEEGLCFVDNHAETLAGKAINGFVDNLIAALPVEETTMQVE